MSARVAWDAAWLLAREIDAMDHSQDCAYDMHTMGDDCFCEMEWLWESAIRMPLFGYAHGCILDREYGHDPILTTEQLRSDLEMQRMGPADFPF